MILLEFEDWVRQRKKLVEGAGYECEIEKVIWEDSSGVRVHFDSDMIMSRLTVWDTSECHQIVIDAETEAILYVEDKHFEPSVDFDTEFCRFFNIMRIAPGRGGQTSGM